jgi:hypothetical protein
MPTRLGAGFGSVWIADVTSKANDRINPQGAESSPADASAVAHRLAVGFDSSGSGTIRAAWCASSRCDETGEAGARAGLLGRPYFCA